MVPGSQGVEAHRVGPLEAPGSQGVQVEGHDVGPPRAHIDYQGPREDPRRGPPRPDHQGPREDPRRGPPRPDHQGPREDPRRGPPHLDYKEPLFDDIEINYCIFL